MVFLQLYNIACACAEDFGESKILGGIKLICCLYLTFTTVSQHQLFIFRCGMLTVWMVSMTIMYTIVSLYNTKMWDVVYNNLVNPMWASVIKLHNAVKAGLDKLEAEQLEAELLEAELLEAENQPGAARRQSPRRKAKH